MTWYVENGWGESIRNPVAAEMERLLDEVNVQDEEHGAVWVATDSGWSLEWNGDGRLVLWIDGPGGTRHLSDVSRERALELFVALAAGRTNEVELCEWQPGNGYVMTDERREQIRADNEILDRRFYDSLGSETAERCAEKECSRGRIEHSIHCRPHRFEALYGRPCPFKD